MNHLNPFSDMGTSIHYACVELGSIKYQLRDWSQQDEIVMTDVVRPVRPEDLEVFAMFAQTWESTATAFDGIGGAAMTTAYTIILYCEQLNKFAVCVDGKVAYTVKLPNELFYEDIKNRTIASQREQGRYQGK